MKAFRTLLKTESKLSLRGMDMFIFAICMPVVVVIILALILAVQVVIYAIYSIASLILIYMTATIFFGYLFHGSWLPFLGAYLLVMLTMFSIGLLVGGLAPNMKTASAVASLLYFPMLIFSGATLPYEVMPAALQRVADILPLTQGIKMLMAASLGMPMDSVIIPVVVMITLTVICMSMSLRFFKWD